MSRKTKTIYKKTISFILAFLIVFQTVAGIFLPVEVSLEPPYVEVQKTEAADYYGDYSDVLIVVNDNSSASLEIGNYFQTQRNIPDAHVVHLNCSTSETINRAEFDNNINEPIANFLASNGIADDINYIVTTKGVPLRVSGTVKVSVDSELASMGDDGFSMSSYYSSDEIFLMRNLEFIWLLV